MDRQLRRYGLHYRHRSGHAYLYGIHSQIGHHSIYLGCDQFRPKILHFGDTGGILHSNGSYSRGSDPAIDNTIG